MYICLKYIVYYSVKDFQAQQGLDMRVMNGVTKSVRVIGKGTRECMVPLPVHQMQNHLLDTGWRAPPVFRRNLRIGTGLQLRIH